MLNSIYPALVITKREVRDQFRDWRIIFPIIGLTIFFPFLMNFTATRILAFVEDYGATIIGERLVPFLMMIVGFFPISVSLVIALESFVGEKERSSIEPLLNTPLQDWQLYVGKLLAATVPPLVGSFLGMTVYSLGLVFNDIPLPDLSMMILIVLLTIVQAIVMVSGAVVVSSQATSVRAANLLSSFIIIPIALLIQGESIVMFWGNYSTLWIAVIGMLVLAILLMRVGLAHFQREELLGREIDVLNIRWFWRTFITTFRGNSVNVVKWYKDEVFTTLIRLRWTIFVTVILVVLGVIAGASQVVQFFIPLDTGSLDQIDRNLQSLANIWSVGNIQPVLLIFWQNIRVLILAFFLGLFSFGIFGVLPLMASVGLAGYLMNLLQINGMQMGLFLVGFILPHGIIEIPAAIIATAGILQTGLILATPTPGQTVGEVWIKAVADWVKLMVGLVVPLLIVSAMIEAWITPRLAAWILLR